MYVRLRDGRVDDVRLRIYEPPRFFEAFLRGRGYTEPPDITARICGICPVAYQMSACAAIEDACGVAVPRRDPGAAPAPVLRRVGREPRAARVHAPRARLPRLRERVRDGARPPRDPRAARSRSRRPATRLMRGRRRARDPPDQRARRRLLPRAARAELAPVRRAARSGARVRAARRWAGSRTCRSRTSRRTTSSSRSPSRTLCDRGRAAASPPPGSTSAPAEYEEHFAEEHVEHSTALHSRLRDGGGPTSSARSLAGRWAATGCRRLAREAAAAVGLGAVCRTRSGHPRARRGDPLRARRGAAASSTPTSRRTRRRSRSRRGPGVGYGWTEAPRGLLWHRYRIDEERHDPRREDRPADLAEPGERSSRTCARFVERHIDLRRRGAARALRVGDPQLRPVHLLLDAFPAPRGRPRVTRLVIGVGNPWRGDDGAGIEVARRLGGVAFEGDGTGLIDVWENADDEVVVVDAAASGGRRERSAASTRGRARCLRTAFGPRATTSGWPTRSSSPGRSIGFRRRCPSTPSRARTSARGGSSAPPCGVPWTGWPRSSARQRQPPDPPCTRREASVLGADGPRSVGVRSTHVAEAAGSRPEAGPARTAAPGRGSARAPGSVRGRAPSPSARWRCVLATTRP